MKAIDGRSFATHLRPPLPRYACSSWVVVRLDVGILHLKHNRSLWSKAQLGLNMTEILGSRRGNLICEEALEVALPVVIWMIGDLVPRRVEDVMPSSCRSSGGLVTSA